MDGATSEHHLIMASRVTDTPVFNRGGERMGHVDDLSIDKVSGQVNWAILAMGGFLGLGEKLHPVPWSILEYDPAWGGYVVGLDKDALEKAPALSREELEALGAGSSWRERILDYYGPYGAVPYI